MDREQEIRERYAALTALLIRKGLTITTMESATAGQIASLITDTEGSSAVIKGAFVTYCNEAKILQGVPEETIQTYTVYSEQTAAAMAEACRKTPPAGSAHRTDHFRQDAVRRTSTPFPLVNSIIKSRKPRKRCGAY